MIGLPIVKKQPHNGMRRAVFRNGLCIPDGVRGEQDGTVIDGLDECAVLAGGVAWEGEHHDAAVTEYVPARAELGVVDGWAGFESSACR